MSPFFVIRVVDGRHRVGSTTDGRDFHPIPTASFGTPRDAIRYADMRQAAVSPLRSSVESEVSLPSASAEQPRGRSTGSHQPGA